MTENEFKHAQNSNSISQVIPQLERYIDVEDGLRRVRGNRKIYKNLLLSYTKNSPLEALEKHISDGDLENAAKIAHSVKGVSANLSLIAVQAIAMQLECEIKSGVDCTKTLNDFSDALKKTNQMIERLFELI